MIEKQYTLAKARKKTIEKVVRDENIHYNHMLLNMSEGLPVHVSNAPVYMTVVKGTLSIKLNDQEVKVYDQGTLLSIPKGITMDVKNMHECQLELIVVKAPGPKV